MCAKLMVIGMDGLTLDRLRPLVESGQLPTFARLLRSGAYGVLHSVTNMTTGPAWTSFATGCWPHQHGILHDFHHRAHHYQLSPMRGGDRKRPAFWDLASEAGRQAIVLNVPMSYPANALNGIILAGIDAPSEYTPGFAYPPNAYQELRRNGIEYLIDYGLASYIHAGNIAGGAAVVQRETEARTAAAEYFMRRQPWDLLVVVYSLPDVWQHYYWTAPEGSDGKALLDDSYRTLDRHLARLWACLPDDGTLLVCSDHGFGRLLGTREFLNNWLAEQKLLAYTTGAPASLAGRLGRSFMAQARARVSFRRRQQLLASVPWLRRLVETRLRIGNIDWTRTQVYAAIDHMELWMNVQGRQPQGIVPPEHYDRLCAHISDLLGNWRDAHGTPMIERIERAADGAGRPDQVLPPDLSLVWNPSAKPPPLHPFITGDHAPEGACLIAGPDIRPGVLPPLSLVDIAPLALRRLGIQVPDNMDGKSPQLLH